ncbi:hypothetical protein NDU88_002579 [Pleurodeles waltl]|uniref:Uncharacterized protein n=1 Tax=Pleurodeles waltl TaxID=8319 RepID=A0AAV7Q6E5_PLEWA|nr:hypothetical protein NDU88_002579 [Pleurodeles waltl]
MYCRSPTLASAGAPVDGSIDDVVDGPLSTFDVILIVPDRSDRRGEHGGCLQSSALKYLPARRRRNAGRRLRRFRGGDSAPVNGSTSVAQRELRWGSRCLPWAVLAQGKA